MTADDPLEEPPDAPPGPPFRIEASRGFAGWLAATGSAIAFTTYQAGKIFLIGVHPDTGQVSVFERSFPRCMGFGAKREGERTVLYLSSLYQLWRFEDMLDPGQTTQDGYDAVFAPVEGRTTGEIDIHDICGRAGAPPLFVATRFNCLATLDERHSFQPVWMPPFIDRLAAEDRCHLNGLATERGRPAYVSAVATTNAPGAWRDNRIDGGVLLDVASGEAVATGLSMPHSPRLQGGTLYCLQSGTGELGAVELSSGRFSPVCALPGFPRGLGFLGGHAVVGVSRPRRGRAFADLPLERRLSETGRTARCMIAIVDLAAGRIAHELELHGPVRELYDVAVLEGYRRPKLLGFRTPEIRFQIRPAPFAPLDARP